MLPGDSNEAIRSRFYEPRPVLKRILEENGDLSLLEYAKTYRLNERVPDPARQNECIEVIAEVTNELLGSKASESIRRQLKVNYYASTTDHLGPLTHPFFVHADLLAGIADEVSPEHENVLVLACSNVSLGNSSFPRSLLFHDAEGELKRLHFFPASDRLAPVFRFHPYTIGDIERMCSQLSHIELSDTARVRFASLLSQVYQSPEALSAKDFASQSTITNERLWKKTFGRKLPRLVYLELEEIVARLLVRHHLTQSTELHRFLFDPEVHKRVEILFDGLPSAFSRKEGRGTFLFWHLPEGAKARIPLRLSDGALVSDDLSYTLPLTPEAVRAGIENKTLLPSMMLSLVTLASYYGLRCLGGFSQVNYLTWFDVAYRKALELPEAKPSSFTEGLCGDFIIALLSRGKTLHDATGIDLILYEDEGSLSRFQQTTERLTLRETFELMLPDLYRMLYASEGYVPTPLTERVRALEHDKKLPPTLFYEN